MKSDGKKRNEKYYLVQENILPEAIKKTIKVKEILRKGQAKTINEAVERMDLSRSAFYKYKDHVRPFYDTSVGKIATISVSMDNEPGMLSHILNVIANSNASILTINQNIPLEGVARVSIAFETKEMDGSLQSLIENMEKIEGILKVSIIGQA